MNVSKHPIRSWKAPATIVRLRWVALSVMVFTTGAAHYLGALTDALPLYTVIAALAVANAVLAFHTRRGRKAPGGPEGQIILDLVALTALLHFAGGVGNPLVVLYVVHAILGAMLLPRRQSFWMAGLGCVLFKLMALSELFGLLEHHPLRLVQAAPGLSTTLAKDATYVMALAGVCVVMIGTAVFFVSNVMESLRERENEVRRAHGRLQAAIDGIQDVIVLFDGAGRPIADNRRSHATPGASRTTGGKANPRSASERGSHEMVRWPYATVDAAQVGRALRDSEGLVWTDEQEVGERFLRHRFFPVDTSRSDGGMVWVAEDVTDKRRLEELSRHRQRMAAAGMLATGVAHEVRNPLASISAVLEDLKNSAADPLLAEDLHMVGQHVFRIDRILNQLLGFARPPSEERNLVDVNEVLREALAVVRFDRRCRAAAIEENLATGLPRVSASRDELVQVFVNLALNALDAMPKGGILHVSSRASVDGVRLQFRDTGRGMAEGIFRLIFDPFFTTKTPGEGAGLGLSVSDSIVQSHGGHIAVESEEGKGAVFTVHLPRSIMEAGVRVPIELAAVKEQTLAKSSPAGRGPRLE
jgi:signal transduction histidine kinase